MGGSRELERVLEFDAQHPPLTLRDFQWAVGSILAMLHNAWFKGKATDAFDYFPHLETEEIRQRRRRAQQKRAELEAHYRWALKNDPATMALNAQLEARKHARPPGPNGQPEQRQPGP